MDATARIFNIIEEENNSNVKNIDLNIIKDVTTNSNNKESSEKNNCIKHDNIDISNLIKNGTIEFKKVCFAYLGRNKPVLNEFTLLIPANSITAIAGSLRCLIVRLCFLFIRGYTY